MKLWPTIGNVLKVLAGCLVVLAVIAGSYKLLKAWSRKRDLGRQPQKLSLESLDPLERIDVAREAAPEYGGDI